MGTGTLSPTVTTLVETAIWGNEVSGAADAVPTLAAKVSIVSLFTTQNRIASPKTPVHYGVVTRLAYLFGNAYADKRAVRASHAGTDTQQERPGHVQGINARTRHTVS